MKENELNLINKYRTAIMGFAALWIYFYHEQGYEWCHVYFSPEIISRSFYFFKRIGYCGVDIFLLLSGIGLVYGIEKNSTLTFFRHRLERVFVPFFITGLIIALIEKWSVLTFIRKLFFYDFLFVDSNSFLWYIPSALILYLFFPLYYRQFKKSSNKFRFTFFCIATWFVFNLLFKDFIRNDMFRFTNRIPVFFVGILLGDYIRAANFSFGKRSWFVLCAAFFAGLYLSFLTVSRELFLFVPMSNFGIPAFLLGISATFFVAKLFYVIDKYSIGACILKLFSFFGTISLEIYCVQDIVDDTFRTMMMSTYEHWMENWWKINIIVFLCVVLGAFILSYISRLIGKGIKKIFSENQLCT